MRRIVIWLASTITVLVLLFGYHTSTNRTAGTTLAPASAPASPSDEPSGAQPSSSTSSSAASSPAGSSSESSSTASPSASKRSSATPAKPATASYTGAEAQTRWGIVQVKITVAGGKITAVDVPEYPQGNPRDAEINSYALPTLIKETLQAQNASIDMVSGATVTSDGYLNSLQSALDKAGIS